MTEPSQLSTPNEASLYFHHPCFDGLVSAVVASDFLERCQGWTITGFIPVGYESRAAWLSQTLNVQSAVVDFIYHPQAAFWADHHSTTFLTPSARRDFEQRSTNPYFFYEEHYTSCAKLLCEKLELSFGYRNPRFGDLMKWADKIDSARYSSVEE